MPPISPAETTPIAAHLAGRSDGRRGSGVTTRRTYFRLPSTRPESVHESAVPEQPERCLRLRQVQRILLVFPPSEPA